MAEALHIEGTVENILFRNEANGYVVLDLDAGGEPITVVSRKRSGCVVSIKDARYNIDKQLAEAILV